jgi:hypothetical protein
MHIPAGELDAAGRRPIEWGRLLAVGVGTVLACTIATVLVAMALGSWLQVPSEFPPLRTVSVVSLTVVGVAFRTVAAVVLVISWAPDLLIWATGVFPSTTTRGVLSLMTLHVVAAGIAVLLLGRYGLPASSRRGR